MRRRSRAARAARRPDGALAAAAPGQSGWADVAGATAPTLHVDATTALAGTRYRAVFESAAGSLASDAATLTVTVVPPAVEPPPVVPAARPPARVRRRSSEAGAESA